MYGILISAFNKILGFVFTQAVVKFGVLFGIFFLVKEFSGVLLTLLPSASSLNGVLGNVSSGVWYFADAFAITYGLPAVVSAYTTRFIIRRIPFLN